MPQNFFEWYSYIGFFPWVIAGTLVFMVNRKRRKLFWLRFIPLAVVMIVFSAWIWSLARGQWLESIGRISIVLCDLIMIAELFILFFVSFKCSVLESFLYTIGGWTSEHLGHQVGAIVTELALPSSDASGYQAISFAIGLVSYLGVYTIIFAVFYKIHKNNLPMLNRRMLIPAAVLLLIVCVLAVYMPYGLDTGEDIVVRLFAMSSCVITLCLIFGVFEEGRLSKELEFIIQLDRKRAEQYEMSKESIEVVNTRCHDLKKIIERLMTDKTSINIGEIEKELSAYDAIVKTDNEAFNTILTEKSLYCEGNGIRLTVMADTKRLGFLSDMDIYSLFGNILDNAIEASMKLDEGGRAIGLSVRDVEDIYYIHSDNLFCGEIKFSGDKPVTSKSNASEHGFGIASIRRIAKKHGGEVKISVEDNVFNIDIAIPIPPAINSIK